MHKLLYLFFASLAVVRIVTFKYDYPENVLVRVTGRVVQDPVVYDARRQITLHGLRAYVELYPEVVYGDVIVLEGTIEGRIVKSPKVADIKRGGGLYAIRQKILSVFRQALPAEHSALVAGIVLGSKADMPEEFWDKLKITGTAHVVVASGMNVTFVTSFLLNTLINFVKRRKAIIIALSAAWAYVVLSGFDAPLVRAAIMGSIAFGAQGFGRASSAIRALFLSATLMLIISPEWISDLGFILSFVATLSLIIFEPKVSRLLYRVPFILKKDLATTIAAQVGVAPILLVAFGGFNLFSPFINALVLWTIPPIMIIGAIAGVVGLLVPALGGLVAIAVFPFSFWFTGVVNLFS